MFATDFIFNEKRASDFDLMICSFNGEDETVTGGEIEYDVIKAPNTDKFELYDAQYNTVLTWKFSLVKNPCNKENEDMYFDQYQESEVMKWLSRKKGYKWFHFDQEGYDDIWYKVCINATPHQVGGRTVGFDLTVTSNCGYGFSGLITRWEIINSTTPAIFSINTDVDDYILPYIEIPNSETSDFYINNENDTEQNISNAKETNLKNVATIIKMDSEYGIITGLQSPSDFNYYFLRLVQGVNTITTDSIKDITLKIQYREARRVAI